VASIKLTNTIRDRILIDMLIHRFRAEADVLASDYVALANDVYDDMFTKAEAKTRDALPDGWLRTEDDIGVKFGDQDRGYEQLDFAGRQYGAISRVGTKREGIYKRMPSKFGSGCAKIYDRDHPLTDRHEGLAERRRALVAAIDEAEKVGKAALYSAGTIGRLKTIWPEVSPFCVKYAEDAPVNLPSLPVSKLNETFGLPVEEAA
jgi:hypothetical protein